MRIFFKNYIELVFIKSVDIFYLVIVLIHTIHNKNILYLSHNWDFNENYTCLKNIYADAILI